ncbi:NADH-quinone oxidoreductase subunit C [Actinopolymorpha cephalotaxi]|uniref:NADH-quinone oxidoreductase subunit C n=1 Tax=Actinopolymorpha cephalotaxi TaxID=504797 RepID=A0A1I2NV14_9ACTN|nr:NADH-quinone oxidoreductase subunit C [Actinopolymorpha cephalotaxi]NYH85439.1 NADH-quinone oxidoreductase subunit C [Actinopolymorpha cephalotaxi]SFG05091.1 NADH-quinone oxidoreductase subunit C [Actinopolymorpha cephalotaxi]
MSWSEEARAAVAEALGLDAAEVGLDEAFGPPALDVPADRWVDALTAVRDVVGCTYFDWLSAVDELEQGFTVVCHLVRLRGQDREDSDESAGSAIDHLLVRTKIPREDARLPTATGVYAGAGWHERETYEMFDIDFAGHPNLAPLLLPDQFEGHPLRKEFVLASRVAKPWPGAKEPGESEHDAARAPSRRRVAPPGVPSPEAWGPRPPGSPAPDPLAAAKPARPARSAKRAERPARRTPRTDQPEQPAQPEQLDQPDQPGEGGAGDG